MRRNLIRRRRSPALALAAAAASPLVASAANTDVYVGASGSNWNNTNDWVISGTSTHVIPATGDAASITFSPVSLFSVTYDGNYTSLTAISSLTLDGSATVGVVLNQGTAGDNLFSTGSQVIGNTGIATFNQTAANNSVGGNLLLGAMSTGQGTYLLGTGASLSAANAFVGAVGRGSFGQTGGTNSVSGTLFVGDTSSSGGSYSLSAGMLSAGQVSIGENGVATFTQSGGTHTIATNLFLGDQPTANGTYILSAGSLSANNNAEFVGNFGTGSFNQMGGTNSISGFLILGNQSGSKGSYALGPGTALSVTADEHVGGSGTGTFTQTGGTHTVGGILTVGDSSGSVGFYSLSAGTLAANSLSMLGSELIGNVGHGSFSQTGGTQTIAAQLFIGSNGSGNGSYSLSGGSLIVTGIGSNTDIEEVGGAGTGTFIQTGGVNNASAANGSIWIATFSGSHGVYNLSGGSASAVFVTVGGAREFFSGGAGTLNVSGTASLTAVSELRIYANTGSSVNFSGGTITAGDLNTQNVPANFVWTGGTLNLTNSNIVFDSTGTGTAASLGSTLTLNSGQTLALSNGNETIGGGGAGSLTLNSASTNTISGATTINPPGTLTLNGGTLTTGTLTNLGSLAFNSGAVNGRLVNQGTVTLAGASNFSPSNGVENDSSMTVPAGVMLTVNGAGLDNLGTFSLSDGTIAGTAAVTNDFGGVMNASGTISQGLTNNGTINLTGVLTSNGAVSNNGVINVPSATTLHGSGAVANNGLVNLSGGAISSALTNNGGGVIQGNGALTNFQANNAGGQIDVPSSGGPLNISSAWTNSGLVVLQGGAALLAGGAITNGGTVQGNGQVSATILNTAGAIQPTGGQLVLAGAGNTNAASGQIQITTGNTLFISQGLATNLGTIALSGGTFDNNNQPLTNNAAIFGNGTLRTGGLTNSATGTISLADVASSVLGTVSNSGHINITNNTTTFFGAVTNNAGATIKVTTGVSRFLSTFTNNGTFSSDPASNYFQNISIGPQGILLGGSGDQFIVTGKVINTSTRNTAWNTAQALLEFTGGGNHTLTVAGTDQGPSYGGFANNFSWGILQLDSGNSLTLESDGPGSALYVEALAMADGLGQVSSIAGNGVNVYYDPSNSANGYLGDQTFTLSGGGELAPVPEPAAALVFAGATGFLIWRRRMKIAKSYFVRSRTFC